MERACVKQAKIRITTVIFQVCLAINSEPK